MDFFVFERHADMRSISKLTGGIAITRLSPWEKPYAVRYDKRFHNGRRLKGMKIHFNVLRRPSPLSNP